MLMLFLGVLLAAVPLTETEEGWRGENSVYRAEISARDGLKSLRVGEFEFLGTGGLSVTEEGAEFPFESICVQGNTVFLNHAKAAVILEFLTNALRVTVHNKGISDGHLLRMAVNPGIARVKTETGGDLSAPFSAPIYKPSCLIAPGGATLSLSTPGSYNLFSGSLLKDNVLRLGFTGIGDTTTTLIQFFPEVGIADALRIRITCSQSDFCFWDASPAALTSTITNMRPTDTFRGEVVLTLRNYVTKDVVYTTSQKLDLASGVDHNLAWTIHGVPPMLYVAEFEAVEGGKSGLAATSRIVYRAAEIHAPEPPEDFDAFWVRTLEEQAAIPPDLRIEKVRDEPGHEAFKFDFAGLLGYRCYGWLTLPHDKSRAWPAVLVLPPAGMRSQPVPLFKDMVGMAININGVGVDWPAEKYDIHTWPATYLVKGILSRDHYSLRFSYAALVRAAEILAARPEVDDLHISVRGSSQGGGLTLVAAGLFDRFEKADSVKPGLCRLDWNLDHLQPPYFPIAVNGATHGAISRTLHYFEPSHFARRIRCPITVSLGLYDDVTPPAGVFCAYNAIPDGTKKTLIVAPCGAH